MKEYLMEMRFKKQWSLLKMKALNLRMTKTLMCTLTELWYAIIVSLILSHNSSWISDCHFKKIWVLKFEDEQNVGMAINAELKNQIQIMLKN